MASFIKSAIFSIPNFFFIFFINVLIVLVEKSIEAATSAGEVSSATSLKAASSCSSSRFIGLLSFTIVQASCLAIAGDKNVSPLSANFIALTSASVFSSFLINDKISIL